MNILEINNISFEDLGQGIYVYHNVLPKDLDLINRLEKSLTTHPQYNWQPAYVGYQELMPEYRDTNP